ncbi:MAG: CRISPR-associated protein Csx16 [Myxococcota bacterium]
MAETIVLTRQRSLVAYLVEKGIVSREVEVVAHATVNDVRDKHLIVATELPISLAAAAACVTDIPLVLPSSLRGKKLSAAQLRRYAGTPVTYIVRESSSPP